MSDVNASVDLHILCKKCRRICQNAHILRTHPGTPKSRSSINVFKHHRSSIELEASSVQGCHFCTLLWDALSGSSLDDLKLFESKLPLTKSRKPKRTKTSYKIDIVDSFSVVGGHGPCFELTLRLSSAVTKPDASGERLITNDYLSYTEILPSTCPWKFLTACDFFSQCSPFFATLADVRYSANGPLCRACIYLHCIRCFVLPGFAMDSHMSRRPLTLQPNRGIVVFTPDSGIDVGPSDSSTDPRLHISCSDDKNMAYLTLSHCWGGAEVLKLTSSNCKSMTDGISMKRLPRTFQDAIIVTRRLGHRYLWIDSLCIFQNSAEDWERESLTMDQVYSNSVLTIAVLWAPDSYAGCFIRRNPLALQPCRVAGGSSYGLYAQPFEKEIGYDLTQVSPTPLHRRAWVLQERLLSARTLYFGPFELHWECHECEASETWPDGVLWWDRRAPSDKTVKSAFFDLTLVTPGSGVNDKSYIERFYQIWNWVLTTYSTSNLTFDSDILIAISGLAKSIEDRTGLTFFAGLWKELLPLDLLWCFYEYWKCKQSSSYPTWSWACLGGASETLPWPGTEFCRSPLTQKLAYYLLSQPSEHLEQLQ